MTRLSPDEYADLLAARRDAYYVDHPPRPGFPAMLDWFIQDGDEDLVDVAACEAANRPLEGGPNTPDNLRSLCRPCHVHRRRKG